MRSGFFALVKTGIQERKNVAVILSNGGNGLVTDAKNI